LLSKRRYGFYHRWKGDTWVDERLRFAEVVGRREGCSCSFEAEEMGNSMRMAMSVALDSAAISFALSGVHFLAHYRDETGERASQFINGSWASVLGEYPR
jgi:hypothetical protein